MRKALTAIVAGIGLDEVLFVVALLLLAAGLWSLVGWPALIAPGAILLWVTLPTRRPFVDRPARPARRTR